MNLCSLGEQCGMEPFERDVESWLGDSCVWLGCVCVWREGGRGEEGERGTEGERERGREKGGSGGEREREGHTPSTYPR